MPRVLLGPFVFASGSVFGQSPQYGWPPTNIDGPRLSHYVVEHRVPGAEGGPVERLGSTRSTYRLEGFLQPRDDTANPPLLTAPAGSVLSGTGYVTVNTDQAKQFLLGLRSGTQLFLVESTAGVSPQVTNLIYENDFFFITDMSWTYPAGHGYPFYRYSIQLHQGKVTYGNSSGTLEDGVSGSVYYSGFMRGWRLISGGPNGESLAGVGVFLTSQASGSLRLAVYDQTDLALKTQTETRQAISGWNYFALRPSFTTTSGGVYRLLFKGNVANTSGFVVRYRTAGGGDELNYSGQPFADAWPDPWPTASSGGPKNWDLVMVA